jgi:hypothetical protein
MWIDPLRRVLFTASQSQGKMGLYRTARGVTTRLLATGDAAPSGGRFVFLLEVSGNEAGDIVFTATTTTPAHIGVYLLRDGQLSTVAIDNTPAPARHGGIFAGFDQVQITSTGEIYFGADLAAPDGRGIFKATPSGLEAVLVPGDFLSDREITHTLQFRANDAGDVASLNLIKSHEFLLGEPLTVELWLRRQGRNQVLASQYHSAGGTDIFLNFAVTFNQVVIDQPGAVSFYAGTDQRPLGAYFVNTGGGFLQNDRLIQMGDPSPLEPGDLLAITENGPAAGALFARHEGITIPVAIAGTLRPGGGEDSQATWSGFQTIEMNDDGAFLFTDFQGLVRIGLFVGRFVPAPAAILATLRARIPTLGLAPADAALLLSRLDSIERYDTGADYGSQALKLAQGVQRAIRSKAGRTIPEAAADALDPLLDDLVVALTPLPKPAAPPNPARFDSLGIDR